MYTEEEIKNLVTRIVQIADPVEVYLFGSYAKGTATIKSDLDFLIVKDSTLPQSKRITEVKSYLCNYAIPVNVLVFTPAEIIEQQKDKYSFVSSVFKSAKKVFTKDNSTDISIP